MVSKTNPENTAGSGWVSAFPSGFNRANLLLLIAIFVNSIPVGFMLVYFSIYFYEVVKQPFIVGSALAISTVANTLFLIPFSTHADRYGRKKFAAYGFALPAFTFLVLAFTADPRLILISSAVGAVGLSGGIAQALNGPAWTAFVSDVTDEKHRAKVFGAAQAFWTLALTVGSILAALPTFLASSYGFSSANGSSLTFILMAVVTLVSALPVVFVSEKFKFSHDEQKVVSLGGPVQLGFGSRIRKLVVKGAFGVPIVSKNAIGKLSVSFFLIGFGLGVIVQILSLWFHLKFGVSEATIAPWFALAEFASLPVIIIIPFMAKRLGSVRSVLVTQLLSAFFLLAMTFVQNYVFAGEFYIGRNFFMNLSWPIQQSYMMGVVLKYERASTAGITSAIWGAAATGGSLVGGYFLQLPSRDIGLSLPIYLSFASYALSAVFFFVFFKRVGENNETVRTQRTNENSQLP
jgi:MFS family permease